MRGHDHGEQARRLHAALEPPSSAASSASSNRAFAAATARYVSAVGGLLRRSGLALAAYAALPRRDDPAVPERPDRVHPRAGPGLPDHRDPAPDGASLERTDAVVRQAADIALGVEGVTYAVEFVGFSGATRANAANAAAIFVGLKPFEERDRERPARAAADRRAQREVLRRAGRLRHGDRPPPVRGLGTAGGFKLYVQDRASQGSARSRARPTNSSRLATPTRRCAASFTTFRASTPQLYADIDRTRAKTMDVPLGNVFEALQIYLGSIYVNDFNYLGRTFQVRAQADTAFRADERSVARFKTRNRAGEMVSLGAVVDLKRIIGPDRVGPLQPLPPRPRSMATRGPGSAPAPRSRR
jgi:multidrug efflux pump